MTSFTNQSKTATSSTKQAKNSTSFSKQSRNSTSTSNQAKNSTTFSNTARVTNYLWSATSQPWSMSLPWQLTGMSGVFTLQTKN